MADHANVHIMVRFPESSSEAFTRLRPAIESDFAHALSAHHCCATPFTEVCGSAWTRPEVKATISGFNTLPLEARCQEAVDALCEMLARGFDTMFVDVVDEDGVCMARTKSGPLLI